MKKEAARIAAEEVAANKKAADEELVADTDIPEATPVKKSSWLKQKFLGLPVWGWIVIVLIVAWAGIIVGLVVAR